MSETPRIPHLIVPADTRVAVVVRFRDGRETTVWITHGSICIPGSKPDEDREGLIVDVMRAENDRLERLDHKSKLSDRVVLLKGALKGGS